MPLKLAAYRNVKKLNEDHELTTAYRLAGFSSETARSRGPFILYLLSEKGFTYAQVKSLLCDQEFEKSDEEMSEYFNDFIKELQSHPIYSADDKTRKNPIPEGGNNARHYSTWFNKAIDKIKDTQLPPKPESPTPQDVFDYLNNFGELSILVKDTVQEYEYLIKNPLLCGSVMDGMGDDQMAAFGKIEAVANALAAIKMCTEINDMAKAAFYPYAKEIYDEIAGKKYSDIDTVKLIRISSELTFASSLAPSFQNESIKGELDPVYSEFLKGNAPELDVNNIKVKDTYSNEIKTVAGTIEPLKDDILESTNNVYSPHEKPFKERMSDEKMDQLMKEIPDGFYFTKNAPEKEKQAVHDFYINTAKNLYNNYAIVNIYQAGKKIPDVITINGRPLSEIVDEKYEDQELTAEQRQTAIEYEFAQAVFNKDAEINFNYYEFNKDMTGYELAEDPIVMPHYDKPMSRDFIRSAQVLTDPDQTIRFGKSLPELLAESENIYHKLYNDSNRLTDSKEFKAMLGSFKELHELYGALTSAGWDGTGEISHETYAQVFNQLGYSNKNISDLITETARNCDTYITEKNATGKYRSTDKGNDRLMCATGFLTSLDGDLAEKKLADVKLKNLQGEKTVRENSADNSKVKVSLKSLMDEGNESRKNVKKEADNTARQNKKRMHERTAKSNNAPEL